MNRFLPQLLLVVVAMLLPACSASKSKDDVLFPPISLAWPGVQDDVERGIDDAQSDGNLDEDEFLQLTGRVDDLERAIDDRDVTNTRSLWLGDAEEMPLRIMAERGVQDRIDDGEIGTGVGASLIERIVQFDAAVAALPNQDQ